MHEPESIQRAVSAYLRTLNSLDRQRLRQWSMRRLTTTQLYLLSLLVERDARSVGNLAEEMQVSPATMTGLTDRLVRQGYIGRQTDPEDRRVVRVVLTPAGRHVLQEMEVLDGPGFVGRLEALGSVKAAALADLLDELTAMLPEEAAVERQAG